MLLVQIDKLINRTKQDQELCGIILHIIQYITYDKTSNVNSRINLIETPYGYNHSSQNDLRFKHETEIERY